LCASICRYPFDPLKGFFLMRLERFVSQRMYLLHMFCILYIPVTYICYVLYICDFVYTCYIHSYGICYVHIVYVPVTHIHILCTYCLCTCYIHTYVMYILFLYLLHTFVMYNETKQIKLLQITISICFDFTLSKKDHSFPAKTFACL
jgi:hypothetical protein